MITRSKVRGMFLGTAVGDALGMPVETWDREHIAKVYPEGVRDYKVPSGHKWFNGQPAGGWTDDTQLTIATARALIDAKGFDLTAQGEAAVQAMKEAMKDGPAGGSGVPGWGYTTVKAVRNLANNVPWNESGKTTDPNLGHGNGVVMRLSPIAAWGCTSSSSRFHISDFAQRLVDFSAMTHYTVQSAVATFVHNYQVMLCLFFDEYENAVLFNCIDQCRNMWKGLRTDHLIQTNIDMWERLERVKRSKGWTTEQIIAEFGGGSCNVGNSLPFCYAFFVNNHDTVQVLYDVIEAGGDTDTNASIVGCMLGSLHGEAIFPDHLVNGLIGKDEILKLADEFCQTFGVD